MSNRRISWSSALRDLKSDRTGRPAPKAEWSRLPGAQMVWMGRIDGASIGSVTLDGGKHIAHVFVIGGMDMVDLGTHPMSPMGFKAACAEVEAAHKAALELTEAA